MKVLRLTEAKGGVVFVNFDHVHFFRYVNDFEKEEHPGSVTRVETDIVTFFVKETSESIDQAITDMSIHLCDVEEYSERLSDDFRELKEAIKDIRCK